MASRSKAGAAGPTTIALPADGLALSRTGLATIGLLGVAFAGLFYHFFYVQNFQAMTNADWSHSYFIPIITLYLLWHKRAELAALRPVVFWPGLILVVLGIMCYALFQLNQALNNHMLRGFSMLVCLFGLILLLLGPRIAQVMFLPIAYLVFGVTLAEKIMRELTIPMRAWSTEGAFFLLSLTGVEAERKGNILEIHPSSGPMVPLNVADACSGLRMVIAFVALAVAVALVSSRYWWQRIALLLLALPVAILMNIVRVAALGVLTLWDPKIAQGESHMLVGYLLLIPAFGLFMGIVWALGKVIVEAPEPKTGQVRWWRPGPVNWRALRSPAVLVALGLLSASALALPTVVRVAGMHLRKLPIYSQGDIQLRAISTETANWKQIGEDVKDSQEMLDELGTQNTVTRTYIRKDTGEQRRIPLSIHLAYYTGGVDAVPHIQERCMVAGGWEIAPSGTRVLPLDLDQHRWRPHDRPEGAAAGIKSFALTTEGRKDPVTGLNIAFSPEPGRIVTLPRDADKIAMRITEFIEPKTQRSLFGGYFFIANGGVTDSAEGVRLLAFSLQDDYAFYCKVQVSTTEVKSAEELAREASDLLSELLPEIMRCVPDWVEVRRGAYPPGRKPIPEPGK